MNKKKEILLLGIFFAFIFVSFSIITAANETDDSSQVSNQALTGFDKSYQCLNNQVSSRGIESLTPEELAFSLLALSYNKTLQDSIYSQIESISSKPSENQECWPNTGCNLKITSQILMAYDYTNKNTSKIESWLKNQEASTTDLVWYMQIDSDKQTTCTIKYDNSSKQITLSADKTITGSAGNCFNLAYNGYWLEINNNCYSKTFEVSCDSDFLTAVLYKKKNDATYYVSSQTHTSSPNGKTTEKVNSKCFKQGSACNYEGTLWASLAFQKISKDINVYLPYLMALEDSNIAYSPFAFLYSLTGFDQYYTEIVNNQNSKGYWQLSDTSKRYYDTAVALMSLYGTSSEASTKAIDYLLDPSVLGEGCWNGNNIRDTSFILYSSSPKQPASTLGTSRTLCTSISSYSCISSQQCSRLNGTDLSADYYCQGGGICCNEKEIQKTCSAEGGITCDSDEECTGTLVSGLTRCCTDGECQPAQVAQADECTPQGEDFACRSQCLSSEEEYFQYACEVSQNRCCGPVEETTAEGKSYWWLWLLVILVILLILAVIFRNQLKVWLFKKKSDFSKSPAQQQGRPPFPPMPPQGMMNRRIIPGQMPPRMLPRGIPPNQRPFPKDKELDDTLRKLKEMGKK